MLSLAAGPIQPLRRETLPQLFERAVSKWPERDALIVRHQGIRLTWRELKKEVIRTASGLQSLGIRREDRVALWANNCAEWIWFQHAIAYIGAVCVNVSPAVQAPELAWILQRSGASALVFFESDDRSDYAKILDRATAGVTLGLKHRIVPDSIGWKHLMDQSVTLPPAAASISDIVDIQYTSGTTGQPKGVLLTHSNVVNDAWFTGCELQLTENDRLCAPVPMHHCFGYVMSSILCTAFGATLVFPSVRFNTVETLNAIEDESCTVLHGVPTMFHMLLSDPSFRPERTRSLRTGMMAGAPCPPALVRRAVLELGCSQLTVAYGQTETSPAVTLSGSYEGLEFRTETIGRPLPGTEVRLVNEHNEIVSCGQTGELCVRGFQVMHGYDGDPAATANAIDAEGWLHTGDNAVMRPDKRFNIVGRMSDLIIRGGENIYPREVEEVMQSHPAIADVCVLGYPDDCLGEVVLAWVQLHAGLSATVPELQEFCRGRIGHYKIPKDIRIVNTIPVSATGKVQRFRIRQLEQQQRQHDQDIG